MKTLYDKIWDSHVVHEEAGKPALLYIDLHLIHEVTSPQAFEGLRINGRKVRRPDLTFATVDHAIPTRNRHLPFKDPIAAQQVETLRKNTHEFGVKFFDLDAIQQGIIHVFGPEQGLTQPGMTIVCGDSHTSTHGAFGALAFGIGTSEVEHVLATQTLQQQKAKNLRISVEGDLQFGVTAKDVILAIINRIGTDGGNGHVIEYTGSAIRGLSMEGRMTVCNMSIEAGAKAGLIAPDDKTFANLKGRRYTPQDEQWEQAVETWSKLPTDEGAVYDKTVEFDAAEIEPFVTWGTSPGMSAPVTQAVPELADSSDENRRKSFERALEYMGLEPAQKIENIVDRPGIYRLMHQFPDRRSPRSGKSSERLQGQPYGERDGRPGFDACEATGRKGRSCPDISRRRFRMARCRLFDVPGNERRHPCRRRALRIDQQPQLRRPPGPRRPNAFGQPRNGGSGGDQLDISLTCESGSLINS